MKILKYDEALAQASNQEWFKNFYSREEICSDEEVDKINELASKFEVNPLIDYFKINEDFLLQKIYYCDLIDFLEDELYSFVKVK